MPYNSALAFLNETTPRMNRKRAIWFVGMLLLASTSALATYRYDTLACSFVDFSEFVEIEKNVYVSPDTDFEDREELLSLLAHAKTRVIATYGQYSATPIIISGRHINSLRIFGSDEYASTKFLPGRSCVVLGPKGHSVDIVAHELVHSEIFEALGYWARTFRVPVWFEEGAAMQVDYRTRYDATDINTCGLTVSELRYSWQFFRGDDDELTRHYANAKNEVSHWVSKVSHKGVFVLLNRIKRGGSFDDTYKAMYEDKKIGSD